MMSDKKKIEIVPLETEELKIKVNADLNTDLPEINIQEILKEGT